jgi:hypothetical protein
MKIVVIAFCAASMLLRADSLDVFGRQWTVQRASDWVVENGALRLRVSAEPVPGEPRRPTKFALLDSHPYSKVTIEGEVKPNARSLIFVYAWQDDAHYNYVHMSSDEAVKQNVHNGVFHVFGGERVRVSPLDGAASFVTHEWTPMKLVFDGESGRCYVEVNGKSNPSLNAADLSLRWGRVGMGSFDETGDFRNMKITGEMRQPGVVGKK